MTIKVIKLPDFKNGMFVYLNGTVKPFKIISEDVN
jgi:hypothetical protein